MKAKDAHRCGVVLPSDVGSDYVCTLRRGHGGDHCDVRHPFSWDQDVVELHLGLEVRRTEKPA